MIAVENICFGYSAVRPILNNVSFDIRQSELCALLGASGSGKSTLLKLLAGILPREGHQSSGKITLDDKRLNIGGDLQSLAPIIGFVFQDYLLLPFLTVRENMLWAQEKVSKQQAVKRADPDEILKLVGLAGAADLFPNRLSGGMKARAAIARALCVHPSVLLVDEAFSALDVGWRMTLYDVLNNLRETLKLTIFFISHDTGDVCAVADRAIVLSGKGSVAAMLNRSELEQAGALDRLRDLICVDHPARLAPRK